MESRVDGDIGTWSGAEHREREIEREEGIYICYKKEPTARYSAGPSTELRDAAEADNVQVPAMRSTRLSAKSAGTPRRRQSS